MKSKMIVMRIAAVLTVLLVAGFVGVVNWPNPNRAPLPSLSLCFEAKTDTVSKGMLIVDGQAQVSFDVRASSGWVSYRVDLPTLREPIKWIRMDPYMVSGTLQLRNLNLVEGKSKVLEELASANLDSLNPQSQITLQDRQVTIVRRSAEDYPALLFKYIYPIRTATDTAPRLGVGGVAVLWAGVAAATLALLYRMIIALGHASWKERLCFVGLFLVVFSARLLCLQHFGVSFHFWDPWDHELWALYLPFQDGNFSWQHLFASCNEHRIFFTRVLNLGTFLVTRQWDNLVLSTATSLMYSCIALGLAMMLWKAAERRYLGPIIALVAMAAGMPFAWENTVWGNQSQFYFFVGFSFLTIWLMGMHEAFTTQWLYGIAAGICSIFTVGAGITATAAVVGLVLLKMWKNPGAFARHLTTLAVCAGLFWIYQQVAVPNASLSMKTRTLAQFIATFGKAMSWPYVDHVWVWPVIWAPLALQACLCLRARCKVTSLEWLLFALGGWCLLNNLGIGIYRGAFSNGPASRYMDLTSIAVVVNGLATLIVLDRISLPKVWQLRGAVIVAAWWTFVLAGVFNVTSDELLVNAGDRVDQNRRSRLVMTRFLKDDNIHQLLNLKEMELPYPDPLSLATWLRCPAVRKIIPASIREPVSLAPIGTPTFLKGGSHPRYMVDVYETVWGSFSQYGNAWQGEFLGKTSRPLAYPYLEFEVQGDVGSSFGTDELGLRLEDAATGKSTVSSRIHKGRNRWGTVLLRAPCDSPMVGAVDRSSTFWLAFKEPREKSTVSVLVGNIIESGVFVMAAGVALLIAAFLPRSAHKP
jgi:hypothetical protein